MSCNTIWFSLLSSRRRAQEGSVLLLVLAVVLVLILGVGSALAGAMNSNSLASSLELDSQTLHAIDGSLEVAVNYLRNETVPGPGESTESIKDCMHLPVDTSATFRVECIDIDSTIGVLGEANKREIILVVYNQAGREVGATRFLSIDGVNDSQEVPGYKVEICDWVLGMRTNVTALKECPVR